MGNVIRSYIDKKVIDYLNSNIYKKVLFKFHHGLGDAVMWQSLFEELKRLYPNIEIHQHLHLGQDELFKSADSVSETDYDIVFDIGFPMNDSVCDKYTKAEYCCVKELGIEPPNTVIKINKCFTSPFVGVHFFSTCLPGSYSCPEDIAKKIWNAILEKNLIPLDTHMKHVFNNPANKHFSWNTCSIDCAKADIKNLMGVLQTCRGFCGVASGNFNLATTLFDSDKILYIKNTSPVTHITRLPILTIDAKKYDAGVVNEWLDRLV